MRLDPCRCAATGRTLTCKQLWVWIQTPDCHTRHLTLSRRRPRWPRNPRSKTLHGRSSQSPYVLEESLGLCELGIRTLVGEGAPVEHCRRPHVLQPCRPGPQPTPGPTCRSRTSVAPLERLKILMQVQGTEKVYTGIFQVGRDSVCVCLWWDVGYRCLVLSVLICQNWALVASWAPRRGYKITACALQGLPACAACIVMPRTGALAWSGSGVWMLDAPHVWQPPPPLASHLG